jgi:PIN domain nuclease of toxin-antitoxin system
MRVLLDTHVFLWFLTGDLRCSVWARSTVADPANDIFVSVASLWEIAIKSSLGKLTLAAPFDQLFPQQMAANSMQLLPIGLEELGVVARLPFHHRDPFDRLLVTQASVHDLPLLSADQRLDAYRVTRL